MAALAASRCDDFFQTLRHTQLCRPVTEVLEIKRRLNFQNSLRISHLKFRLRQIRPFEQIGSIATAANTYITNNTISDFLTATAFGSGIEFESTANPSTNNVVMTGNSVSHSLAAGFNDGYRVIGVDGDLNLNFQDNTTSGSFGNYAAELMSNDATFNIRMRNNTLSDNVLVGGGPFSHQVNFEVFGGQTVPNPLVAADVTGQDTISGTVTIQNLGGGVDRVAPNSLPIPE
ncbi:hypothetical protein [Blastopirellula retiformator]|uniref:Right handed beta helix domain-containing protein n=1 Tax=Blastopirellula retiformator TaxID=2527970 RepID=A0A5C5VKD5_9BACT|nr:hypothetical protein [Blastopirellula retiformator]TWT38521.1 hypothetical protein Enr8_02140 [Blastopirellula retiformator]